MFQRLVKHLFKCLSLLLFITIVSSSSYSQVVEQEEYSGTGYGSLMMSLRSLDGKPAIFSGGGGGFVVKDVRIGVFYNGLTNWFSKKDNSSISFKLACSYGGIWIGYPIFKNNDLHGIADMKFSIGNTRLINTNWIQIENGMFYGFTPSLGLEYNLSEVFMICGGLEYHYSFFPKPPTEYREQDFSSPGIYVSVKLGLF